MKTITLTDDAYERLKSWKESPKESFSKVILKQVPKRGTAGALDEVFDQIPPITEEQARVMEETVIWGNNWGRTDLWEKKSGDAS